MATRQIKHEIGSKGGTRKAVIDDAMDVNATIKGTHRHARKPKAAYSAAGLEELGHVTKQIEAKQRALEAAAPAMLDALRWVAELLSEEGIDGETEDQEITLAREHIDEIFAAIRKATA